MAEKITPDRLREIVQRHKESAPLDPKWGPISECDYATADRGELLDLLRTLAQYKTREHRLGCSVCRYCGRLSACEPGCPAPLLEVLRG